MISNSHKFTPASTLPSFVTLEKLRPGDKVSVVASSAQVAAHFPHVYEHGLRRLREQFGLVPLELPSTRASDSSLQERAEDLLSAFRDPESKAVISLIGGDEQILMLRYLDPEVFLQRPKPFFGYSDNTNLALLLWSLGIPSYYGGCLFTEYAMSGQLHPFTEKYLRLALFESEETLLTASGEFTDQDLPWEESTNLALDYEYEENEGWIWDGGGSARGILWGGCLETLGLQLKVGRWMPSPKAVNGTILCLETSELLPEPWYIKEVMIGLGERGFLSELSGLLVARPKARAIFRKEPPAAARMQYRAQQREALLKEFRRYNKNVPVVMNLDFGHTKPQIPLPIGRPAYINCQCREVRVSF